MLELKEPDGTVKKLYFTCSICGAKVRYAPIGDGEYILVDQDDELHDHIGDLA